MSLPSIELRVAWIRTWSCWISLLHGQLEVSLSPASAVRRDVSALDQGPRHFESWLKLMGLFVAWPACAFFVAGGVLYAELSQMRIALSRIRSCWISLSHGRLDFVCGRESAVRPDDSPFQWSCASSYASVEAGCSVVAWSA